MTPSNNGRDTTRQLEEHSTVRIRPRAAVPTSGVVPRDDHPREDRAHLLSPRRASDTMLAPLAFLRQGHRPGSVTDPSLHASPSRQADPFRRSLDSPPVQHAQTHMPVTFPNEQSQDLYPSEHPGRAWDTARMDVDEPRRYVRPRRSTLLNPLSPLAEPSVSSHPGGNSAGHKRKLSHEVVSLPQSYSGEVGMHLAERVLSSHVDSDAPSLKRRGSSAAQNMAHLSIHDRHRSLESPPGEARSSSQWFTRDRRDSAMSHTFSTAPPPPFSAEPPHGHQAGGMAPFAWPSRPLQTGSPHMSEDMDPYIARSQRLNYPSSPPGPPPPMPPTSYAHDRRLSAPTSMPPHISSAVGRPPRPRSRASTRSGEHHPHLPPLSALTGEPLHSTHPHSVETDDSGGSTGQASKPVTPYSRSPELRVSHKLAERKRRKEMKDLFDELRDHLPADRGMKSSKWEILSKAVDYISQLKATQQDMGREIEVLRHELDGTRKFNTPSSTSATFAPAPSTSSPTFAARTSTSSARSPQRGAHPPLPSPAVTSAALARSTSPSPTMDDASSPGRRSTESAHHFSSRELSGIAAV